MFQTFNAKTTPDTGKLRLEALRTKMAEIHVDGFLIPRSDTHMGEYVSARDRRLEWLTSFTGSAGYCAVFNKCALLFVDGRYTLQATDQIDTNIFEIQNIPNDKLTDCINTALSSGGKFAYDPWLHTEAQIEKIISSIHNDIILLEVENLIDAIWIDQPDSPLNLMTPHSLKYAGIHHSKKLKDIGKELTDTGQSHVVLTQPDSIAWALNTRGTDLGQTPVALCFATVAADGRVNLFINLQKVNDELRDHLGSDVIINDVSNFSLYLESLTGSVRIDPQTAPIAIKNILENANISVVAGADPTILAKACKNKSELDGCIKAHIRDGAAVVEFLSELKNLDTNLKISEIDLVKNLENKRIATGKLKNISFDTICGSGPNGAIVHYRVNTSTNRTISTGDVLLIDSGGQYLDGTTDITRTIAIGSVPIETVRLNTLVLKGMIAISCLRFPKGLAGRDIDAIARQALWSVGLDFDHGTGHGVGSFLSVHEGPHGISRHNQVPFEPGMIISNEPGYYEEGHFGIRIENLIYVKKATNSKDTNSREMLKFETLTLAPIDQTLIDISLLSHQERKWINDYHANVLEKLYDLVSGSAKKWLNLACAPL